MKTILTVFLTLAAMNAFSGEIKIFDTPTYEISQVGSIHKNFNINHELGRAWVVISFDTVGDGPVYYDERVMVKGLSFNQATNEIILDTENDQIVCATVKKNFLGTHIKNTGKCTFKQKSYSVKVDNGYEVETVERLKITLNY